VQDTEGYSFHAYALPQMQIPCDPTGQVVARRMVRQFVGLPARRVARIANNSETVWTDTDRGSADVAPPPASQTYWMSYLPVADSPVWQQGFGVRYAVEFEYADGTVVRGGWWRAERQEPDGYSFHDYAMPQMNIPCDPTGEAVARRVVRQFRGWRERVVARIANNSDALWTDTDIGLNDKRV
jgi:hypothetical protein